MHNRIMDTIYKAIDQINEMLPNSEKITKTEDTVLFGSSTRLDSLGMVNLIVAIEEKVEDDFGLLVTLTDQFLIMDGNSENKTVGSLTNYIHELLGEKEK